MDEKLEKVLGKFKEELKQRLGDRLRGIVLYGSGARADFAPKRSDVNVLVALDKIEREALGKIGKVMKRYRAHRFATPIVVDKDYIERSLDVFPMEFLEMQRSHKIIYGEDLISELKVPKEALRVQLERELKQSLLWLRELLIEYPKVNRGLTNALMNASRSISAQIRALSFLLPGSQDQPQAVLETLEQKISARLDSLNWLSKLRSSEKMPKKSEIERHLPNLLYELDLLVKWVDNLGE